jgi:hypothetical protein
MERPGSTAPSSIFNAISTRKKEMNTPEEDETLRKKKEKDKEDVVCA